MHGAWPALSPNGSQGRVLGAAVKERLDEDDATRIAADEPDDGWSEA